MTKYGYIQFKPFSRNVGPQDAIGSKPAPLKLLNGNGEDAHRYPCGPNRCDWVTTDRERERNNRRKNRIAKAQG